jgi:hypothetical protein
MWGGKRHAPAAFPQEKRPGTHCKGGWVDPSSCLGRFLEISLLAGFDSQTYKPVASSYTDCAIPAHSCITSRMIITESLAVLVRWLCVCARIIIVVSEWKV